MKICNLSKTILVCSTVSVLTACSAFDLSTGDTIDYKNSRSINTLEIPPSLNSPDYDPTYATLPGGAISAAAVQSGVANSKSNAVLPSNAGAQILREGNVRYLQVAAPADAVWPKLQEFWQVMGIGIKRDEPRVGIMETDWAENKAEIPLDVVRKTLGKAFEGLYDAGARDRFKIRLERPNAQVTNIFLSHERAEEHVSPTGGVKWEYKPAKPQLEGEMLNRLMIFVQGGDPAASRGAAPVAEAAQTSVTANLVSVGGGQPALQVAGAANDTWIRTGVMLGRIGMSIEDQQRAQGVYVATFQGDPSGREKQGFFKRVFKSDRDIAKVGARYQIQVADAGNSSLITIGDADGTPLKSDVARNLLTRLKSEFER